MRLTFCCGIVLAAALPGLAFGKSTYLECNADNGKHWFSVSLDEDAGKATHRSLSGDVWSADGMFSANEVTYKNVSCNSVGCYSEEFSIDRTTLEVSRVLTMGSSSIGGHGSCDIVETPNRQF